jgi:hypothetical protein
LAPALALELAACRRRITDDTYLRTAINTVKLRHQPAIFPGAKQMRQ